MAMVECPSGRRLVASAVVGTIAYLACADLAHAAISCVAPPTLSNPIIYDGKCPGESGFPADVKANYRDVYVKLPTSRTCSKGLTITYAKNIRIMGGHFVYNDSKSAVISIGMSSGVTMIDGVLIDVNKKAADAIRTYKHTGRMIVQNTFAKGIGGTVRGVHGDLVHAQGGGPLQELTLQNVTGLTGYQGLFAPYRPDIGHGTRKLKAERVNIGYDPGMSKSSGAGKPLMLLFIGSADNSEDRVPDLGTTLSSVHVDGSYWSFPYYNAVYAKPAGTSTCTSFASKHKINGQVCGGKPATDYAPASRVGRSYNRSYFCY